MMNVKFNYHLGVLQSIHLPKEGLCTVSSTAMIGADGVPTIRYESPSGESFVPMADDDGEVSLAYSYFAAELHIRLERYYSPDEAWVIVTETLHALAFGFNMDDPEEVPDSHEVIIDHKAVERCLSALGEWADEPEDFDPPFMDLGHDGGVWTF